MTHEVPRSHSLHRLFRGLTETTFMAELGIGDPGLVGYVADLLARFVPSQNLSKIRDPHGRPVTQVVEMIAEAESSPDIDRRRECHRHVGDYTLFWTGVYPEAVNQVLTRRSSDQLIDFQAQGKRSYYLASTLEAEDAPVLRRLSEEFELCAFGLSRVRKQWEHHEPHKPRGPSRGLIGS